MQRLKSALLITIVAASCAACDRSVDGDRGRGETVVETPTASEADAEADLGAPFTDIVEGTGQGMDAFANGGLFGGGLPTLDPSITAGLDPGQATGLMQDPGLIAKGTIDGLVTFADLSLIGVDLDLLYDYLYKPETENAQKFRFPERAANAAGEDRAVIGYMIATEMKPRSDAVLEFMLVKDLLACCYGGAPRPDEFVLVSMKAGDSCEYIMYRPVIVRGDLKAGRIEDDYGFSMGVYRMTADTVEAFEPGKFTKGE